MSVTFPIRANTQPAVKDIDGLISALRKTGKEAGMSEKEINDMVNAAKKAGTDGAAGVNKINKEVGSLTSSLRNVASGFATMIAVDKLIQIGQHVIHVRAEFEKLSAVLTNTLGSQSRAQEALRMIQDIAAKTPFSVLQLTQSYVKLVNQGFKPTNAELIKLGDLAASTGKEIDQLTEALIDAQVGEFERLKDFGIRASKEGDKVTFTFKEVEKQTDFTSEAIREYMLSLGDLQGVKGSMVVISETLGGKINNLGDSFDKLANMSGGVLSPALGFVIDDINNMIAILTDENLGKFEKMVAIFGGNSEQRAQLTEILNKQRELINTEKERAIQSTVNAALASGNIEAYIKAIDGNIYKEEIIARIREKQAKDLKDADALAKKAAEDLAKQQEEEIKNWQSAAEKGEKYRKEMQAIWKMMSEISKPKLTALSDEVNKMIDGVGAGGPVNNLPKAPNNPDFNPDGNESFIEFELDKQALQQATFDQAISLASNLFDFKRDLNQQELSMLQNSYQQEIMMAGDNEDAKDKITRDFQRKQFELQNKQMKLQNEQAIFQIVSSQGPAIAKTLASGNGAFSLPLAISLLAFFGSLIASQRKIQAPRFAAGGAYDIDGPGTETSDSIPFYLSKHETVTPAHATKKFGELLKPMLEPSFDWAGVKSIVDRKLPSSPAAAIILNSGLSEKEYGDKLDRIEKAIENKRETHFSFDENGFGLWMGRGQQWTKYVKSRYSM